MTALASLHQLTFVIIPGQHHANESVGARRRRWCLHLLFWSSLLAGLWCLNRWGGFERFLHSPWPSLHRVWLPLLAVPIYVLGWLSVGLWASLRRDPIGTQWPELDAAWNEARGALERAEIDLAATPVFLMLGPSLPELLESLGALPLINRSGAPLQMFARREAIYVTCAQLSLPSSSESAAPLEYLCRLLVRERDPQLPIQGIVRIVPIGAMRTDADTRSLLQQTQAELRVVRQATGLDVPLFFAVSGVADGAECPRRLADALPGWRLPFPPLPDLDPAEINAMFAAGVDWLCLQQIPAQVRPLFRLDEAGAEENKQIYRWLHALQAWRTPLRKLLIEAAWNEFSEPGMVAGCYVLPAGKLALAPLAQALQADLLAHQRTAAWTAATIVEQATKQRRTWLACGLALLGLFAALMGSGAVWYSRS